MLLLGGNEHERETARQCLQDLLDKNKKAMGDVDRLIALSVSNPEKTRNDDDDEAEPPPTQQTGKVPDVYEMVDWALRRFLFLEDHQYMALSLWILHTFVFREFQHTPRLALLSPVRGCGKSVALNLCQRLCLRARKFGSTSTAVLPRLIDTDQPSLLLDEADNLDFANDPILRAIVNDGFEQDGVRAIVIDREAHEFKLFAPLAFGAIGRLPLPLMSRSIVINMSRASRRTTLERYDLRNKTLLEDLDVVYRCIFVWAQQVRAQLDTNSSMPDGIYGRTADRWRVLISIADALGHGDQAREAAKIFAAEHTDEEPKIELLADIRRVFDMLAVDQISAESLLQHLLALDDGRWTEFRGEHGDQAPKHLRRAAMVKMISSFGVRTKTIWPRHRTADSRSSRGYARADFEQVWESYCDESDTSTQPSAIRHLRRP
jgi:Protein of unknown function (DUF3631)